MPAAIGDKGHASLTVTADRTADALGKRGVKVFATAWDDKEKIGEGRHERVTVPDLAKFLGRVMKKTEP